MPAGPAKRPTKPAKKAAKKPAKKPAKRPAKAAKPATTKRKRVRVESLRWAAQFGYLDEVKRFLAEGSNPDGAPPRTDGGPREPTPLEMACFHRKAPVVRVLLAAGASARKGDPLRCAVTSGSKRTAEMVRMLLDAGADPFEPGYRDGETVADLCRRGFEDVRDMLLAAQDATR